MDAQNPHNSRLQRNRRPTLCAPHNRRATTSTKHSGSTENLQAKTVSRTKKTSTKRNGKLNPRTPSSVLGRFLRQNPGPPHQNPPKRSATHRTRKRRNPQPMARHHKQTLFKLIYKNLLSKSTFVDIPSQLHAHFHKPLLLI
jgi:hypothetical protein